MRLIVAKCCFCWQINRANGSAQNADAFFICKYFAPVVDQSITYSRVTTMTRTEIKTEKIFFLEKTVFVALTLYLSVSPVTGYKTAKIILPKYIQFCSQCYKTFFGRNLDFCLSRNYTKKPF